MTYAAELCQLIHCLKREPSISLRKRRKTATPLRKRSRTRGKSLSLRERLSIGPQVAWKEKC